MQYSNNLWLSDYFTPDKGHVSNFCLLIQSICCLTDLGKMWNQWAHVGFGVWRDAYSVKLPVILQLSRNRSRCPMSPHCCPPGRQSVRKMPSLCPVWRGLYWGRKKMCVYRLCHCCDRQGRDDLISWWVWTCVLFPAAQKKTALI